MNIKILTFGLISFIIMSMGLSAQKLKDDPIKIKYVKLPSRVLPEEYNTYSVNASGPLFLTATRTQEDIGKSITMDGFKRLDGLGDNVGHLRLELYGGEISAGRPEFKTRTVKSKDKAGKEITTNYYSYEVQFNSNSSYRIVNPEGKMLHREDFVNAKIMKTKEYTSASSLNKDRMNLFNNLQADYASETASSLTSSARQGLVGLYDYDFKEDRINIYLITKHASEGQWQKNYDQVTAVFKEAEHYTPSEELKAQLQNPMDFYRTQAKKNPRGDKKLKRIYKAANYNLAVLHYAIDEFAESKAYAEKVIVSEKKDRRSRLLVDKIERWEKQMDELGINTIHYYRNLENAVPPSAIAALEAEKEEMLENTTTSGGTVFIGAEEIIGTWSMDKEAEDLIFGEGGNIKFVVEENAEMKEISPTDPDVTAFTVADRNFKKVRFSPSAKGETEASLQILEEVYSSERIKLFKFYPSSGALSDDKTELALQKKGDEFPISLESTPFLLWKKGLAKYFADCPDLAEMISDGGIEKTKEDLIKAARVYSEICEEIIKP